MKRQKDIKEKESIITKFYTVGEEAKAIFIQCHAVMNSSILPNIPLKMMVEFCTTIILLLNSINRGFRQRFCKGIGYLVSGWNMKKS